MNTDSFIVHVKTEDIYKDIAEDETRFDTLNFELQRPLPKSKNKKVIGLLKDELGGQIVEEFVGLRVNTYRYLKDNGDADKKSRRYKFVIYRKLKPQNYKNYLEAAGFENKINHLEKNKTKVHGFKKDKKEFIKHNKPI